VTEAGSAPPIRAVLFDIDGTILSTGGAGAEAWCEAFQQIYEVPVDIEAVTESGMPDNEVASTAFRKVIGREPGQDEIDALTELYLKRLPDTVASSSNYRLTPGIVERLEDLQGRGLLLGLTTGNIEPAARAKLERADLNRFFSFGGFGSDSPDRAVLTAKAVERGIAASDGALAAGDFIAIGDTPRDVDAGHKTGIRVIGVATGHFSEKELTDSGADWVLATVENDFPV
jgi:phosphoglycolate phosphatase